MYPSSVQHLNLKYIVLRATPKIKNPTRFEGVLLTFLDLKVCLFCVE
jgi:hypothetical protein